MLLRDEWRWWSGAAPRPLGLAAWLGATLPAPLVWFTLTHRWEERPTAAAALWWSAAALPVLGAVVAARWTDRQARLDRERGPAAAALVSVLAGAVLLIAPAAFYRWVVPLPEPALGPAAAVLAGLVGLAAAGGLAGHALGRRVRWPVRERPARGWYAAGLLIAAAGAVLAAQAVGLGATASTSRYDEGRYGSIGEDPNFRPARALPAAGRYAIYAVGPARGRPDCRISGHGLTDERATPVETPPGGYGSDWATLTWVATFTVPEPGDYTFACRTAPDDPTYAVGEVPQIRGAVRSLIHWPRAVIWLLGAVPGLAVAADTARRRAAKERSPR